MWNLIDIPLFLINANIIAKENGYLIGLYGSVLNSSYSKHDLDLVVFKYVDNPNESSFINNFIVYFDGHFVDKYEGLFANGYVIEIIINGESHLIDLSIRK